MHSCEGGRVLFHTDFVKNKGARSQIRAGSMSHGIIRQAGVKTLCIPMGFSSNLGAECLRHEDCVFFAYESNFMPSLG